MYSITMTVNTAVIYRAQNETYMCRSAENVVKVCVSISYVLSAEMAVQNEAFT